MVVGEHAVYRAVRLDGRVKRGKSLIDVADVRLRDKSAERRSTSRRSSHDAIRLFTRGGALTGCHERADHAGLELAIVRPEANGLSILGEGGTGIADSQIRASQPHVGRRKLRVQREDGL